MAVINNQEKKGDQTLGVLFDGGKVRVIDLARGEQIPDTVLSALTDRQIIKTAFNAQFERICLSHWLKTHGYSLHNEDYCVSGDHTGNYLDPASWRCTMVWSAYLGLPLSLAGAGAVLGLEKQKLDSGKDLIRFFCKPCTPTKNNGMRTRNLPEHAPEKWRQVVVYNERDVVTEMEIQKRLAGYPVPEDVWEQYHQDQQINDRGIKVDTRTCEYSERIKTK